MKIRLADYVADFLVNNGIKDCFTVTGGGAMHLNDALGHKKGLTCLYNHHEHASAMAAEAYARVHNRIAAVCVTSGPGGAAKRKRPTLPKRSLATSRIFWADECGRGAHAPAAPCLCARGVPLCKYAPHDLC